MTTVSSPRSLVLVAADAHLAPRTWVRRMAVEGDSYYALFQIVARAVAGDYAALVLAGDTLDTPSVDPLTLSQLALAFAELRRADVPVYFLDGNHDRPYRGRSILEAFGALRLDDHPAEAAGMRFRGLSYRPRSELLEALAHVPECDCLVMHAAFRHLLGFSGAWQVEAADIPDRVPLVVVGDVHVKADQQFGATRIMSPGSWYPTSLGELGAEHGCFSLAKGAEPQWHPLDCRRVLQLPFSAKDAPESLAVIREEQIAWAKRVSSKPAEPWAEAVCPLIFLAIGPDSPPIDPVEYAPLVIVQLPAEEPLVELTTVPEASAVGSLRGSLSMALPLPEQKEIHAFLEGLFASGDRRVYISEAIKSCGGALTEK